VPTIGSSVNSNRLRASLNFRKNLRAPGAPMEIGMTKYFGKMDFSGNLSYHISHGKVAIRHGYVSRSKIVHNVHNYRLWTAKAENAA
jgi:hypothetical protein